MKRIPGIFYWIKKYTSMHLFVSTYNVFKRKYFLVIPSLIGINIIRFNTSYNKFYKQSLVKNGEPMRKHIPHQYIQQKHNKN